jgi:hypothetical protein
LDGRGRGKENILCTFSLHEDKCGCQVWKAGVRQVYINSKPKGHGFCFLASGRMRLCECFVE